MSDTDDNAVLHPFTIIALLLLQQGTNKMSKYVVKERTSNEVYFRFKPECNW